MSFYGSVKEGDTLILHHEKTDTLVRARSAQVGSFHAGSLAYLEVSGVEGLDFPVESMTINVNYWEVYEAGDPAVEKILSARVFGRSER